MEYVMWAPIIILIVLGIGFFTYIAIWEHKNKKAWERIEEKRIEMLSKYAPHYDTLSHTSVSGLERRSEQELRDQQDVAAISAMTTINIQ